ncbi:2OG-Fe(II) oxygenase [Oricola sp.]|uniref:2OG-Fe(II) oxygenase n=1 Tax=Oricola sp. TaxID=1979950 RepID=UPI003BAD2A8B
MQDIEVEITLAGGKSYNSVLPADSPFLRDLYYSLALGQQADAENPNMVLQIPLQDGHAACSFLSSSLVSVVTKPPVLIQSQGPAQGGAVFAHPVSAVPAHVRIDDFLTPEENRQLLDFTLESDADFEGSTVLRSTGGEQDHSYRRSKVLFSVKDTRWRDIFLNRLKMHLPHISKSLGRPGFEFHESEIQLTASNDGDFFKRHSDADHNEESVANRVITFVYYFYKSPKAFEGGDLLLYGANDQSVTAIQPENNMLVAFLSDLPHEVDIVRCPSREFADSRFTINGWLRVNAS